MSREFLSGNWHCWSNVHAAVAASYFFGPVKILARVPQDVKNYLRNSCVEETLGNTALRYWLTLTSGVAVSVRSITSNQV
jgi:hypothetical protein